MNFPADLRYTNEHEWIKMIDDSTALVGITDFAQSELGDIVFVEIETEGEAIEANGIFGTIEAVKTVSDLFLPVDGTVLEVNSALADNPDLVNSDPYGEGWLIKLTVSDPSSLDSLMDVEAYQAYIG